MASRVLLISTNRCATPDPVFPLGLAHLDAALRSAGHEVRWLDLLADPLPLEQVLADFHPHLAGISLRNIDDVLIRKRETYFDNLKALCERIRSQAGCPVALGGSGFSIFPKELMEFSGADYGVCGAGEEPLLQLLDALESGTEPEAIAGLVRRRDGETVINPPSGSTTRVWPLRNGSIPQNVAAYYLCTGGMLNVQTQRGCGCHCCYCTYPVIEGRSHRRRDPDEVAEEFEHASRMGAKYVFIVDSVFNSSPRHAHDICEALIRRDVKISWGCFLRPQGLTSELVSLMARAGLQHIEFGSDSFSNSVLAEYHKGFTFSDVLKSSELARQHKVDYCHFLIAGGPGETDETLREGFENSQCLSGAVIMAVVGMRIYPGTQLCQRALAERVITPSTNLLKPVYYVAAGLTPERVFARLEEFARASPNWIVGDPSPAYASLVERLRKRGVVGPLWSYLSLIQRFWPQGLASPPAGVPESAGACATPS